LTGNTLRPNGEEPPVTAIFGRFGSRLSPLAAT
jgi:hypothetical protein